MTTKKKKKTTPAMDLAIRELKKYGPMALWSAKAAFGPKTIEALLYQEIAETYRPDFGWPLIRVK